MPRRAKGLLALVFLLFAWVFNRVDPPARGAGTRAPSLFHLPSMIVAVAVAGWWYAVMYDLHGARLLHEFWGDQVAENMKHVVWQPLYRIPAYAVLQLVGLLPWTLALLVLVLRDRRALPAPDARRRWIQRFVPAWSLAIAVLFGLGEQVDPRYVLPAAPLLAILLADALQRADPALKARVPAGGRRPPWCGRRPGSAGRERRPLSSRGICCGSTSCCSVSAS